MTWTKSLLFATAAGFISVCGAQAADLPVKAKAVQYVKICSLYGAGFYYIPGTDMCIKVGGYVRTQAEWGSVNGVSPGTNGPSGFATSTSTGAIGTITNGTFDRAANNFNMTGRGVLTVDARNQSEYGTVRGYIRLGGQSISNGVTRRHFSLSGRLSNLPASPRGARSRSLTFSPPLNGSTISRPRPPVTRTTMASI